MERLTRWDEVNRCYKIVRDPEQGRSVIQELGMYETIHEKDIETATKPSDIRDKYLDGYTWSDYWEKK